MILILTNPQSIEKIKSKILQLIQQWGIIFEDDPNNPLFTEIYTKLKERMDGFPNEADIRAKLSKTKKKASKKTAAYPPQSSEPQQFYSPPVSQPPAQARPPPSKPKKNKPVQRPPKPVVLSSAHQTIKRDIDGIVESVVLTNSMIDAASPNETDGLDLITELVGNIRVSETQLLNIITSVENSDLVDYAIKANDD